MRSTRVIEKPGKTDSKKPVPRIFEIAEDNVANIQKPPFYEIDIIISLIILSVKLCRIFKNKKIF